MRARAVIRSRVSTPYVRQESLYAVLLKYGFRRTIDPTESVRLERLFASTIGDVDSSIELRIDESASPTGVFVATIEDQKVNVAWLSVGWPRQVRALLARADNPDLVAAPELSPGARHLLDVAGISWFDGAEAWIHLPNLKVLINAGRRPVRSPRRNLGWTASTLAVSEALLTGAQGTVSALVTSTGLAQSTVATSLKFLQAEHLLESTATRGRNARRSVADSDALLDAYAAAAQRLRSPESIRVGVLWRDPLRGASEVSKLWKQNGIRWSATGALAADVLAPMLTEVTPLEIYVEGTSRADLRHIAVSAGVQESKGGRLLLRPFPTPALDSLSRVEGAVRIACWPQRLRGPA